MTMRSILLKPKSKLKGVYRRWDPSKPCQEASSATQDFSAADSHTQSPRDSAVAAPSDGGTLSSEATDLSSSLIEPQGAYWHQALQRLSESERKTLETLALSVNQDVPDKKETATQAILNDRSSSQLASIISEKINRLDDKAWKFRFRGRNIILRDLANKVLIWLTKFKEVGDIAVQYDPMHAALPWAAAATAEQELAGHMLIGTEKVTYLLARCQVYRKLYLEGANSVGLDSASLLEKTLVALYSEIMSMLAHLIKLANHSLVNRSVHATLNPSELSDRVAKLEALESKIEADASNCERETRSLSDTTRDTQFNTLQGLFSRHVALSEADRERYFEQCKAKERCEILQWISGVQYEADLYNARRGRTARTGQWLLDDEVYLDWRNTSASICLWLHGIPGAGKTKLSTKVVDDLISLSSTDEGVAYFFCDQNREDHRDPIWVLRTFVRQLAASQSDTTIVKCVRDRYMEMKARGFASNLTVEDCNDLLLGLTNIFPQTTFVLDGLDECNKETRHLIMDTLDATMHKARHPIKVFIASREHEDITGRYSLGDHLKVTASRNQEDIERFVSEQMLSSRYCQNKMKKTVREQVLKTFKEKSDGMFQWAALHIRDLLSLERDTDVLKFLNDLPFGIEAAYDKIYERIDSQRGGKRHVAMTAMKVLICAQRDLTLGELAIAACQDPDEDFNENIDIGPIYVLDACQDLIQVSIIDSYDPKYLDADEKLLVHRAFGNKLPTLPSSNFFDISQKSEDSISKASEPFADRVRCRLWCRFSHLSVMEYLTAKWDIYDLNAYVARICLRTLLRFSVPLAGAQNNQEWPPDDVRISSYWSLDAAYSHIEQLARCYYNYIPWRNISLRDTGGQTCDENGVGRTPKPPKSLIYDRRDVHELYTQSPIRWLEYSTRAWHRHIRLSTKNYPLVASHNRMLYSLVETFYGHPLYGSPGFRFWVAICRFLVPDFGVTTNQLPEMFRFGGYQSFIPAFWCASTGDLHFLVNWLDQGILDASFRSHTLLRSNTILIDSRMGDIFYAAVTGHQDEVCHEIIARGVVQDPDGGFDIALDYAISNKLDGIFHLLMESCLDIHRDYSIGPLLHVAADRGSMDMVKRLVERGADVDLRASSPEFSWQLTPLELSCFAQNDDEITLYLINKASNINANHPLAILMAAFNGKTLVLESLVSHGADVNGLLPVTEHGGPMPSAKPLPRLLPNDTPIQVMIQQIYLNTVPSDQSHHKKRHRIVIKALLELGADPNAKNADGHTMLQFLALRHHMDYHFIGPLVWHGADVSTKFENGSTILQIVCYKGDLSMTSFLINNGADANAVSGPWRTALYAAYIRVFIPNQEECGDPLSYDNENLEIVRLLLEMGAQFRWEDYDEFDDEEREELKPLALLSQAYKEQPRKLKANGDPREGSSYIPENEFWQLSRRKFYGGSDGFLMMSYDLQL